MGCCALMFAFARTSSLITLAQSAHAAACNDVLPQSLRALMSALLCSRNEQQSACPLAAANANAVLPFSPRVSGLAFLAMREVNVARSPRSAASHSSGIGLNLQPSPDSII